jgi:hypothetical protein
MPVNNYFGGRCRAAVRLTLAAALLAVPLSYAVAPTGLHAQQKLRTVEGTVTNPGGQPISGAVVYLKNAGSLTVKTYVTTADGYFRFGQIAMDTDFQVWAESSGSKSQVKNISSFDSRPKWTIPLKIK